MGVLRKDLLFLYEIQNTDHPFMVLKIPISSNFEKESNVIQESKNGIQIIKSGKEESTPKSAAHI